MMMLRLAFLYLGFFVLILVIAYIFRRYQRTIFWAAAICMFLGIMFTVGFGVIDVFDGNRPNMPVVTLIVMVLIAAAVLAIGAEKLHAKQREREKPVVDSAPSAPSTDGEQFGVVLPSVVDSDRGAPSTVGEGSGVVLLGALRSDLAEKVFARAIEAGYMEERGTHYKWKELKVLLAYMCGRIYCGDYPEYDKNYDLDIWKNGRLGFLPETELNILFGTSGLGKSRSNRKDCSTPTKSREIDKFFE